MQFNTRHYNDQRYNLDGVFHISTLTEAVTETDGTQVASFLKALSDALTVADSSVTFLVDLSFVDFLFLDDAIQIQFANKALNDTVRLADWLSIERNPAHNGWFD